MLWDCILNLVETGIGHRASAGQPLGLIAKRMEHGELFRLGSPPIRGHGAWCW